MNRFESVTKPLMWFMAVLLAAFVAGCGGGGGGATILGSGGAGSAAIAPTVTAVVPLRDANDVATNITIITARFSEPMNPITAANFTVACTTACAKPPTGAVTLDATKMLATFTLANSPLLPLTTYTAWVTGATSLATGLVASPYNWNFKTLATPDTTRPSVTLTIPADAAPTVAINTAITAVFSEEMNFATLETASGATSFTVVNTTDGGINVPGTVAYVTGSRTAVFTPTAALIPNKLYTATVSAAATDTSTNLLLSPVTVPVLPQVLNPWTFTTAPAPALDIIAPIVNSTTPVDLAGNVPVGQSINATFNEKMNTASVVAAFKLNVAGAGGAVVGGSVSYDPINSIATFVPTLPLTPGVTYTALIEGGALGAKDVALNPLTQPPVGGLPVPNPWNFTIPVVAPVVPPKVDLRSLIPFAGGGGAGVTSCGNTYITGDLSTTSASTLVTGLTDGNGTGDPYTIAGCPGIVNGKIYTAPPAPGTAASFLIAQTAENDAQLAFNESAPAVMPGTLQAAELGGLTLAPGVYESATSFDITLVDLTLDAAGNPDASWVFQSPTTLTVGVNRRVILANGAQAKNVFWHVGSAATINGGAQMKGTILAFSGVSMGTNASLVGRAIALVGGPVTLLSNIITVP